MLHDLYDHEFVHRWPKNRQNIKHTPLSAPGPWYQVHCDGHEKMSAAGLQLGTVGINVYAFNDQWSSNDLYMVVAPNVRKSDIIGHIFLDFMQAYGCKRYNFFCTTLTHLYTHM